MRFALTLLHRNLIIARADARYTFIRTVLQPAIYLLVFGLVVGRLMPDGAGGYGAIVAPGIIAISVVSAPLIAISSYLLTGYYFRTMEEWLLAPVSLRTVFLAMVFAGLCSSLVNALLVGSLAWAILGLVPHSPVLLLAVVSGGGLLFSLLVMLVLLIPERPEKGQELFALLMMVMTFLGCTFYSLDMLDEPLRSLALLLPTTYVSEGLRAAYLPSGPHLATRPLLLGLGLATLALYPAAEWAFRRRLGHFAW